MSTFKWLNRHKRKSYNLRMTERAPCYPYTTTTTNWTNEAGPWILTSCACIRSGLAYVTGDLLSFYLEVKVIGRFRSGTIENFRRANPFWQDDVNYVWSYRTGINEDIYTSLLRGTCLYLWNTIYKWRHLNHYLQESFSDSINKDFTSLRKSTRDLLFIAITPL